MPHLSLIWAMDHHNLIGRNNALPWQLPADMAWFREHTLGKTVLMGRKTFDSIGQPLPKRRNIILTQQQTLNIAGAEVIHALDQLPMMASEDEEIMVMGGSQIYALTLPLATRLYCTHIDGEFAGDSWFPPLDWSQWQRIEQRIQPMDEKNHYSCHFSIYARKGS
ncbi:MAG: dihydrofolate reductase [Zetaproteobacteria bacterium]|nr:dihydrofolate reductase [Zetaproteobacteria bacterium]